MFCRVLSVVVGFVAVYFVVQLHSAYFAGVMVGVAVTFAAMLVYFKFFHEEADVKEKREEVVVEVQAVKEYQPVARYEVSIFI